MTNSNFMSPVKWIKISLFAECTNYTIDAIKAKRSKGIWKEGVITKRAPDGCVLINIEAYNKWVESGC
ncbi:MAG: excisionase [Neisseriales bacterium]|nr:MAG: excisionase [Neisseriales bacterium]